VNGLPLNGALARAYDPHRLGRGWGAQEELLALIAELVDANTRMFLCAHLPRGQKPPKPIFIRRPDDNERKARPKSTPSQTKKLMREKGIKIVAVKKGGEK
jgi:hypothetical protein